MQTVIIQTHADEYPRWTQKVTLSGKLYKLYFSWNERLEIWQMSISNADDELLIGGLCLVSGVDLLKKYRVSVPELPSGLLVIIDKLNNSKTAELDRDNFGSRFLLGYFDLED